MVFKLHTIIILFKLKKILNWEKINKIYSSCYRTNRGAPTKKTDLSLGLILLKHLYKKPDRALIDELHLNNAYMYFCSLSYDEVAQYNRQGKRIIDHSTLVKIRARLGHKKIEAILKAFTAELIDKKIIEDALCVVNEIGIVILKSTAKRYKKLKETGEKIIDQIEAKLKGKKVVNRIVSYYEDHSRALPKGKISKPCEFGLKLRLDMSKNSYITNHKLYTKNIAGINIIEESVKSHAKVFGRKFSGGAADKIETLFSSSTCCNIKYNSSCKHGGSYDVLVGYINAHKVHAAC